LGAIPAELMTAVEIVDREPHGRVAAHWLTTLWRTALAEMIEHQARSPLAGECSAPAIDAPLLRALARFSACTRLLARLTKRAKQEGFPDSLPELIPPADFLGYLVEKIPELTTLELAAATDTILRHDPQYVAAVSILLLCRTQPMRQCSGAAEQGPEGLRP
jgi:hypothetical protein